MVAATPKGLLGIETMSRAFQEQFRQAVTSMLTAPEYHETFTCFLTAYEYRKQFPWLEEHVPRRKGQSGLSVALQTALATYIVPRAALSEGFATPCEQSEYQPGKSVMSPEWIDEFMIAVTATIEERLSLERFAQRLARASVNVEAAAPDVLQKHIASALCNYYAQRKTGLSPDPF